jgi:ATP-dependent protease HslVU (ClpYQ) peptidase subunit
MTCIVGIAEGGKVYIGGDSAGVAGLDVTIRSDKKVFHNGDFIFGFTTSFRMGQLLQYSFVPPKRFTDKDLFAYMVTDFINAVRDCFKSAGYAGKDSEVERGGTFLVGHAGRLFSIEGDYQVGEQARGYHSVGCGADYANGSLYTTSGLTPEARIQKALESAAFFSAGVSAPFNVVNI